MHLCRHHTNPSLLLVPLRQLLRKAAGPQQESQQLCLILYSTGNFGCPKALGFWGFWLLIDLLSKLYSGYKPAWVVAFVALLFFLLFASLFIFLPCLTVLFPHWGVPTPQQHTCSPPLAPALAAALDRFSHHPNDSVASPAFLSSNNPPSFVRFLHQWPHCSLIKANPLLALEIFTYQWISLRPHQPERSSLPAPPPHPWLPKGNGQSLHSTEGTCVGCPDTQGCTWVHLLIELRLALSWEMIFLVLTLALLWAQCIAV